MKDVDFFQSIEESMRTELEKRADNLIDKLGKQFVEEMQKNKSRVIAALLDSVQMLMTESSIDRSLTFQINIKSCSDEGNSKKNVTDINNDTIKDVKTIYDIKPLARYEGFSQHDCEAWYSCPVCGYKFGSWSINAQEENDNGTDKYCPKCKTELSGLD